MSSFSKHMREANAKLKNKLFGEAQSQKQPVLAPAPGYCKHCKQYTIEEPLPAEPVQEPLPFGIEERAGVRVLYSKDGSCRPATAEEWLMWGIISAAISGDKERAHGIGSEA